MYWRKLLVLFLGGFLLDQTISEEVSSQTLPSGCNDLEDGLHYIQPMSQDDLADYDADAVASPIKVYCSSGYAVIDPNLDEGVINYFSSYHKYTSSYAGPSLDDHVTWKEWWLPSTLDSSMLWSVSEDCQTCLDTDTLDYGTNSVYYMTADSYGCNWPTKNICDYDPFTLVCSTCTVPGSGNTTPLTGKCGHVLSEADTAIYELHEQCTEKAASSIPSTGTTSEYCVCFKPSTVQENACDISLIDTTTADSSIDTTNDNILFEDIERVVYLYQEDFLYGTYRITEPGTYIIAEDIEFDFNAGDLSNPNAADAWFPHTEQQDDYPGANDYDGWYWLGFFAGITVETANVVIDLNDHEIKMSPAFYFQQRWFICIELNNKAFLDGQGPAWTGTDIVFSSDVTIKNGIIGLSSHMGIHGNNVTNVVIENVQIRDFETHGIDFNEFSNLQIKDVEIGPSVKGQIGLNGNYGLARISLFSIRGAASETGDATIQFASRNEEYTLQELTDRLVERMDLAFKWAYYGIEGEGEEWEEAKKLFIHEKGTIFPGTLYGLVLRSRGASVFNYDICLGHYSDGATIENLNIHDLMIDTIEYVATSTATKVWARDPINAPVTFEFATDNGVYPLNESIYTGNVWTDVIMGMRKLSTSWWYLARLSLSDDFVKWAETGIPMEIASSGALNLCNFDTLGHISKGVLGIKIEGVNNVAFTGLTIQNIVNIGALGSSKCGEYTDGTNGGMPLQIATYNEGYGATPAHAIAIYNSTTLSFEDVEISNIFSAQAFVYGMYIARNVYDVTLKSVSFEHLSAGVLNEDDYSYDHLPNKAASTCAIEARSTSFTSYSDITAKCLYGHTYCSESICADNEGTCFGDLTDCDTSTTYELPTSTVTISDDLTVSTEDVINFGFESVTSGTLFTSKKTVSASGTPSISYYYYTSGLIIAVILMGLCAYTLKRGIKSPISYFNDPYSGYVAIGSKN